MYIYNWLCLHAVGQPTYLRCRLQFQPGGESSERILHCNQWISGIALLISNYHHKPIKIQSYFNCNPVLVQSCNLYDSSI
jgi:hypothetical protein